MYKLIPLYAIVLILAAGLLHVRIKLCKEKKRRREAERNLEEMELIAEEIRNFRHEYNNLFQTTICYIENEQWDLIKAFKNEILQKTTLLNNNNRLQLLKIKNRKVRSVLLQLSEDCDKSGIHLQIMLSGEISRIPMDDTELCSILKFCMDNISEEVKKSSKKEITVKACADSEGVSFLFDSSFTIGPKAGVVYTEEFVRSHPDWKSRWNTVQRILNKNKNVILNNCINNKYFRQEVMIS